MQIIFNKFSKVNNKLTVNENDLMKTRVMMIMIVTIMMMTKRDEAK